MTFTKVRNYGLIKAVLTHRTQVRASSDDGTDLGTWKPNEDPAIVYLEVREAGELLGIVTFIPMNAICFEVHAALLPRCWGERTREALRGAFDFLWRTTAARRIVASIPTYNSLAIALARRAGMTQYGLNPDSFLKDGKLHDQLLVGITASKK